MWRPFVRSLFVRRQSRTVPYYAVRRRAATVVALPYISSYITADLYPVFVPYRQWIGGRVLVQGFGRYARGVVRDSYDYYSYGTRTVPGVINVAMRS